MAIYAANKSQTISDYHAWYIYFTLYGDIDGSSFFMLVDILSFVLHPHTPDTEFIIGSGNGLVPSGNKPLPEPMLNSVSWGYRATRDDGMSPYLKIKPAFFK